MSTEQMIGLALTLLIMLVGLLGSILPAVPGPPLSLAAAIGHRLYFGAESASMTVLIVLVVLTVVSEVLDYLASAFGAKKLGATWRGALGAVIGGLIGIFFGVPGIILGPFLGATLFELLGQRGFATAAKAGTGAVLGLALGIVGKCSVAVIMMILFTVSVISRSTP